MGKSLRTNAKPGELVLSAIKKLTVNTGWTARTIVKFIKMEYEVCDPRIGGKISRALKRGVRLGLLHMERGRYRLKDMSRLARSISDRVLRQTKKPAPRERSVHIRSYSPPLSKKNRKRP